MDLFAAKQHASAIRSAVDNLNSLIRTASVSGVEIRLSLVDQPILQAPSMQIVIAEAFIRPSDLSDGKP